MADSVSSKLAGGSAFALHCRGDVRLYRGDADCTPKSKKGRALLAILAAEQRPLSRVKIIDLLWSDRQEEQARASLRTLLADLKQQFNSGFDDLLVVDRERIALGPGVRTDLTDAALARTAGELFEGLDHIDPELDEWLRVERQKWAGNLSTPRPADGESAFRQPAHASRWLTVLVLAMALLGGLFLHNRQTARSEQPVIAVLKFRDLSGGNGLLADGIAEQLRIELSQNPALQVVSRFSSESEAVEKASVDDKSEMLGATVLLEGSVIRHDGQLALSLRLVDPSRNRSLWSSQVALDGARIVAGKNPVAAEIVEVLGEVARRSPSHRAMQADPRSYNQLFEARALLGDLDPGRTSRARQLLTEVVSRNPNFAPALTLLAQTNIMASDHPTLGTGKLPYPQVAKEAEAYARRAIAVAPDYGPAHGVLGHVLTTSEALKELTLAAQLSPGSAIAHADHARALMFSGAPAEKILAELRIAAKLDPLNRGIHQFMWDVLLSEDRVEETRASVDRFLSRGLTPLEADQIRGETELFLFGDYSNAFLAATRYARVKPDDPVNQRTLQDATLALFGRKAALPYARQNSLTEVLLRGDVDQLVQRVDQMGPNFWQLDYETLAIGNELLLAGHAQLLVRQFDEIVRSGVDPLRLWNPVSMGAFAAAGRGEAAVRLSRANLERFRVMGRNPDSGKYASKLAPTYAAAGDKEAALRSLAIAQRKRWWTDNPLLDHPYRLVAFKPLWNDPRFRALVDDYDKMVARERSEVLAEAAKSRLRIPRAGRPVAFH